MKERLFYPESIAVAEDIYLGMDATQLPHMSNSDFMRVWCSAVYLNPGLHSDCYDDPEYVCEPRLHAILAEVWRRADADLITEELLYPDSVIQHRLRSEMSAANQNTDTGL